MQDGYHRTSAPRRRDLRRRLVLPGRLPAHRQRDDRPRPEGQAPPRPLGGRRHQRERRGDRPALAVGYDQADPTSASLPAGGTSAVVSGVIVALGGILIAVGLAAAAFLAVVL